MLRQDWPRAMLLSTTSEREIQAIVSAFRLLFLRSRAFSSLSHLNSSLASTIFEHALIKQVRLQTHAFLAVFCSRESVGICLEKVVEQLW